MNVRRRYLVTPAFLCVLPLILTGCGTEDLPDPRTATPLVRSALVEAAGGETRAFTGVVAARVQSDLGFRVPGKVLQRFVDAGQMVKRGQLLMRLDPVDLKLALAAQEEAVAAAKARALQAAGDELRYRELKGTGAISVSAYDQVKAAADAANAQLNAARAQADVARNASRYSELLADGDGVVTETLAEPGQVVGAGQPVVRLAHAGGREAVIQLPETLRPAVGSVGRASLYGQDDISVPARLRQLAGATDRVTRTFEARYVLDGQLASAPIGATVTVRIGDASLSGQAGVQVPMAALYDAGKGPGVWVIASSPAGSAAKVSWRPVRIQRLGDDRARVTGQLRQGDQIVALGAHLLHEGDVIRVDGQVVAGGQAHD